MGRGPGVLGGGGGDGDGQGGGAACKQVLLLIHLCISLQGLVTCCLSPLSLACIKSCEQVLATRWSTTLSWRGSTHGRPVVLALTPTTLLKWVDTGYWQTVSLQPSSSLLLSSLELSDTKKSMSLKYGPSSEQLFELYKISPTAGRKTKMEFVTLLVPVASCTGT